MEFIGEIIDSDVGLVSSEDKDAYHVRKAARAIILNGNAKIALLHVSQKNYHKLPGGGLEKAEDIQEALRRETLEEVGIEIDVIDEVGMIMEFRDQYQLLQISYAYLAVAAKEVRCPEFTEDERKDGFVLKWVSMQEAMQLLEQDEPDDYTGKFIVARDRELLAQAIVRYDKAARKM